MLRKYRGTGDGRVDMTSAKSFSGLVQSMKVVAQDRCGGRPEWDLQFRALAWPEVLARRVL